MLVECVTCVCVWLGAVWVERGMRELGLDKANSKLSFLHRNLKGCPEKLKQTAYFSLIRSFMEYGATVWDPYQKYNSDKIERVQGRAARFVKSRYSRYSSVSDMLDVLG